MDSGEWSALAEWTGIMVSLAFAGYAAWKARGARDHAAASADAQTRMADALDLMARSGASGNAPNPDDEEPEVDLVHLWERVMAHPFIIEPRKGKSYSLRNVSTVTMTGISIDPLPDGVITRDLPGGITLENLQSHPFLMAGTWGHPVPSELRVHCDQLEDAVLIPVPERF